MKIETKRLILRKPRKSDWKDIVEGCNNPHITRYVFNMPYPYKKKDALEWIGIATKKWREKERYDFFIELKSEKKVIGGVGLRFEKDHKVGSTGSWINEKYWRNGFITEAKLAVNDLAFDKLGARKLETGVAALNKVSNAVQKSMGYKIEGKKRKSHISKSTGKINDEIIYGMMKEEWKKVRPKIIKKLKKRLK